MVGDAQFSRCGEYRYWLTRRWGDDAVTGYDTVVFIGLNPSTADASTDDPTIRRCVGFAKAWGFKRLVMCNLFAFRATDPRIMKEAADPVGPENDRHLCVQIESSRLAVAAWGTHGSYLGRDADVLNKYRYKLKYLRLTKNGAPSHPLYLPKTLLPLSFNDKEEE